MRALYNFSIYSYRLVITIASLFNSKAKLWIKGRKNVFQDLEKKIENLQPSSKNFKLVWFHCASLGEFEQGRPLIEKLQEQNSKVKILLTFFSPSGYEIRKNYSGADIICYLPIDTVANAKRFISIVKPDIAFFVKYEFWFNYLNELKKNNIKTYLVSGIFREKQHFFKWYGAWFRKQLSCFNHFFVQDENSKSLLTSIGYKNVTVAGDTRFDRVYDIAKNVKQFDLVKSFCDNKKVLIVGSAWKEDVEIVSGWFNSSYQAQNYKLIIAPHEINENTIQLIERKFITRFIGGVHAGRMEGQCLRFSIANEENINDVDILIIDNIGMLSSLYQYGTIAFIGGGFGKGIHNILEAATFGLPVVFGSNYKKFAEAKELLQSAGAFTINNNIEFEKVMNALLDEKQLKLSSQISKNYVNSKVGATQTILNSTGV